MQRVRDWWQRLVRRYLIDDDVMDDERLRWQAKRKKATTGEVLDGRPPGS